MIMSWRDYYVADIKQRDYAARLWSINYFSINMKINYVHSCM